MNKHYCIMIVLSIIMILTACTGYIESDSSDKYDDIISIAVYTKNQYDSNTLQKEVKITRYNLEIFENNENISEIFSNDKYCYTSAMIDEDTVIIHQNTIFQSATGYIVTKKEQLDTIDENGYRNPRLNVPSSLGYDGNYIDIKEYLGEFENWYLYSYSAGL